jgi:hypothetical protein
MSDFDDDEGFPLRYTRYTKPKLDWAQESVKRIQCDVTRLLRAEHRRSLRVVRGVHRFMEDGVSYVKLTDILAALRKGRV